jgi:hypothetical protein
MPGYNGTFYLENMLDVALTINGEFADPGTIGSWVASVSDESGEKTTLNLITYVKEFSFVIPVNSRGGFFHWSYQIGIEKIPPLNILKAACLKLSIINEEYHILYNLDTIDEKDIIKDDWGNYFLQIK